MKKIILLVIIELAIVGCHRRYALTTEYFSKSYIGEYGKVRSFNDNKPWQHHDSNGYCYYYDTDDIFISCEYDQYLENTGCAQCISTGRKKEIFDSLARKHHDTSYYGLIHAKECCDRFDGNYGFVNNASAADMVSITVISNEDWDSSHPAGASLNDIILYKASTIEPFILSGYDDRISKNAKIEKRLSEMTPADFCLNLYNGNWFTLNFLSRPDGPTKRYVRVTIDMDDGQSFVTGFYMETKME